MVKLRDLTQERFGMLTVVERAPNKKTATMWKCVCDCGNTHITYSTHLIRGSVTNCGCKHNKRGPLHHQWGGTDIISGDLWGVLKRTMCSKRNARKNLEHDIDIEYATNLYHQQNGKCALTGIELITYPNKKRTASIDRIDSNIGYIKGNIQWVHKDVNRMKNIFEQNYFIDICKKVAQVKG